MKIVSSNTSSSTSRHVPRIQPEDIPPVDVDSDATQPQRPFNLARGVRDKLSFTSVSTSRSNSIAATDVQSPSSFSSRPTTPPGTEKGLSRSSSRQQSEPSRSQVQSRNTSHQSSIAPSLLRRDAVAPSPTQPFTIQPPQPIVQVRVPELPSYEVWDMELFKQLSPLPSQRGSDSKGNSNLGTVKPRRPRKSVAMKLQDNAIRRREFFSFNPR